MQNPSFKSSLPFLTVLFLALLMAAGCKKDPVIVSAVKLSPTLDNLKFDVGSYWIYGMPNDTLEDSVYITSVEPGSFQFLASEGNEEDWDYLKINYHSSLREVDYFEVMSQDVIRANTGNTDSTRNAGELLFAGELATGELIYSWDGYSLEARGETENLQAGPLLWPVAKWFNAYEPDNPINGRDRLYYVEEVGRVRMEYNIADSTAQTWNLLRYRAVPYN